MPEQQHTPAPTASRGIYGFVIYLLFATLFVLYVLWAFIPLEFYEKLGITELPNKYFALFLPILILTGVTLFAFFIYPSMRFMMTPNINSINTITDSSSVYRCTYRNTDGILCDNKINRKHDSSWKIAKKCEDHQMSGCRIANFCDCVDQHKCQLSINRNYIDTINRKENLIQNSADLDIYEVSEILYGKK